SCFCLPWSYREKKRRASSGTTLSPKAQEHQGREVEHHRALARQGVLRCFACGQSCYPNAVKRHPKLSVHVCHACHDMYHSGTFEVQDADGRENYCRMCGDGGEIVSCDERHAKTRKPCPYSFCLDCLELNFGAEERVRCAKKFKCWICDDGPMEQLRRRIPGYEPNSKVVMTSLILNLKRGKGGLATRVKKPPPPGRRSNGNSGGGAATAVPAAAAVLQAK
ncbi:unnamed protein product, partial [Pylaiella littoralis]